MRRLTFGFTRGTSERVHWLDFLAHEVPKLRSEGWHIDIDPDFAGQFTAVEVEDSDKAWAADLKEQEGSTWWFSLDLGITVEGKSCLCYPFWSKPCAVAGTLDGGD